MPRWLFCLIILLCNTPGAYALDPNKVLTQYVRQVWLASDGLPLNAIFTITQTRDGYIWVGTHEGLARFDGIHFTTFNRQNTPILNNNRITVLCEAPSGALWIGTGGDRFFSSGGVRGGGLFRYDQGRWQRFGMDDGLPDDIINALTIDPSGTLWAGTMNGLVAFDGQRFTHYTAGLPSTKIAALRFDRQGILWIGTTSGLARFQQGRIETTELTDHSIQALYEDQAGCLWIGTQTGLLYRPPSSTRCIPTKVTSPVTDICEDPDGNLWVSTYTQGLIRCRGETIDVFTPPPHPGTDTVTFGVHEMSLCLLTGREGELWVGTGRGLYCFHDGAVTPLGEPEGLLGTYTYPILQDRAGVIWVGTSEGGLSRIEQGKVTATWGQRPGKSGRPGLPGDDVLALCEDHTGALWLGSSTGLTRKEGNRFTTYRPANGLSGLPVRVIHEEPDGSLLIGAGTTLCRFAGGKFTRMGTNEGYPVPDAQVLFIGRDRDGNLWIGTNRGLVCQRQGRFTLYGVADGLPNPNVKYLYHDSQGILWFGTAGGLVHFANHRFTAITTRQGLFDDNIHVILVDDQDRFWMSSNLGIFTVPRAELIACAEKRQPRVTCRVFGPSDGMRDQEGNGSRQPAGCRAADGSLWFPTTNGIAILNPVTLPYNASPPPVTIERLLADGQSLENLSPVLPVHTQTVEIHYTGLSFILPKQVTFAYQLSGLSQDWQAAGSRRTAYFSGLPPGTYTFRVRAFNRDGVASANVAEVRFSIPAPWYRTRLAYAGYLLLALSLIAGGVRWRLAALRQLALRLEQTVAARTAEIYQQQEALRGQRDEIERKNAEMLESIRYAERIQRALLPRAGQLTTTLTDAFVVYLPRDIVSGDFYWLRNLDADTVLLAVGDCTGHGVPGALMSMIGITLLDRLIQEGVTEPALILEQLHLGIRRALQQDGDTKTAQDGMDIGLCRIERATGRLCFSGAALRAYLVTPAGELTTIKGDTKSIGGRQREAYRTFTHHEVDYADGTMLYLLTDGFTDQKNPTGERYGSRRTGQKLQQIASLPAARQAEALSREIHLFRGTEAQLDDIAIVGVRLTVKHGE
jgi:ligand-binding sensor domain-containing protein/serine phosphatase RsbU (regulator of sigma subunit)